MKKVGSLLVVLTISFLLLEGTMRWMTYKARSGILRLKYADITLLPLRPERQDVQNALAGFDKYDLLVRDPLLGWTVRPSQIQTDSLYQTNSQAIRTDPDNFIPKKPSKDKIRIVTVGDSFVFCYHVKNGETWQDYLAQRNEGLELLNMGIPGGATDQAYLRWKHEGKLFNPDIVILGVWPDNINRNLSIFPYYRSRISLAQTKPRFTIDGEKLQLVNYPILSKEDQVETFLNPTETELLDDEYWLRPEDIEENFFQKSRVAQAGMSLWNRYQRKLSYGKHYSGEIREGIDVTKAIVKRFVKDVEASGALPVILMIPDPTKLHLTIEEDSFPLVNELRDEGIQVINMGPTFGALAEREGTEKYYAKSGSAHHNANGNRVFAEMLDEALIPLIEKAKERRARLAVAD